MSETDHVPKTPRIPQLGILDTHPIQYHSPLYQRLTARGNVKLTVLYLYDHCVRPVLDPAFGVPISWNIELLSGYGNAFLAPEAGRSRRIAELFRWIRAQDVVVIYGHSNPWMLFSAAVCRSSGVPYLLRGDSGPRGRSAGIRRGIRNGVARALVSASAGGLAVGKLNQEFYAAFGAPRITFAPHSVDNDRFADTPEIGRGDLLARLGLDSRLPVIMFCGKLVEAKRPLDLAVAVSRLTEPVSTVFVGDGKLADQVRAMLAPGRGVVTGFVNQAELPAYYHAADILVLPSQSEPWGLVVNEAMAAGVLPVVSDRVGAGPDLVEGIGEIYPCGDVDALAAALRRALARTADPQLSDRLRRHVDRYSVEVTATGFEQAAVAAVTPPSR
jgi:glycosyltransferase involved in cell wall biosynthesis